ncbi:MAG: hypothetical protein OEX00_09265, partial [Gammaproteobacteria bacterium]|nr:hypothetical protein [Gammaproteobacteria bacterium]
SFPEFDTDARSHISETQYDGYVGLKLSGLWNNHISIRTRFRQLEAEEYNSTVTSGQVQIRLGKKFLVSPRLTNRNRQYHNGNLSRSSEPTLAFEYRGKATSLYSELGVNRTVQVSGDTETGYELWYLTVSTVWRFE